MVFYYYIIQTAAWRKISVTLEGFCTAIVLI